MAVVSLLRSPPPGLQPPAVISNEIHIAALFMMLNLLSFGINPQKAMRMYRNCMNRRIGHITRTSLLIATLGVMMTLGACSEKKRPSAGSVERLDTGLDSVIANDALIEVIGEGFNWSEGPLWVE